MNGRNAKTNFPREDENDASASFLSPKALSELLTTKLKKCCSKDPSPSLTCLRLDSDNSHIGVWQKTPGPRSHSNWVLRVHLGNAKHNQSKTTTAEAEQDIAHVDASGNGVVQDEEEKVAMQMIEELLNWNCPYASSSNNPLQEDENQPPFSELLN